MTSASSERNTSLMVTVFEWARPSESISPMALGSGYKSRTGRLSTPRSSWLIQPKLLQSNYTQVMTPGAVTPLSHFFAERECVAVAVQAGGGPKVAVAVTVTFADGVKPCVEPLPEK